METRCMVQGVTRTKHYQTYDYYARLDYTDEEQEARAMREEREIDEAIERERQMRRDDE